MCGNFRNKLMIWYDIFVNCNSVATRWQQYSTHLHTNSTQKDTKQIIYRTTKKFWKSSGRAPSLRVILWHLPYNGGKSMENPQTGYSQCFYIIANKLSPQHVLISLRLVGLLELVSLRQVVSDLSHKAHVEEMKNTLSYFIRKSEGKSQLDRTSIGGRKILTIWSFEIRQEILALQKRQEILWLAQRLLAEVFYSVELATAHSFVCTENSE
jgi:hypothetical protein